MSGQLTLYRPSANRLLASLHQLKDACQPKQEASEEPLVPAETTVDLDFLEKRVAAFIGRGWSDKVLEGLAEVYADVAASVTFLLGLKECTPAQRRQGICTTLVSSPPAFVYMKCLQLALDTELPWTFSTDSALPLSS